MMGGMMLSVPIWQDVPTLMGWVGLAVAAIGAVAQVVKILHDMGDERRKAELHRERMQLIGKFKELGDWEKVREMLEDQGRE